MKTQYGPRAAVLAVALLAFVLRIYHLDGQSLWYDEGFSVYLAQQGLAVITARTAADIQPPVYYYVLHVWMQLAGASEFAVRFLSVLFGVLTVPLIYHLGRRLLGPQAGVLAALLIAVSPFHIWYAQEARMYTLVTALGVFSSWLLLKMTRAGRPEPPPLSEASSARLWGVYALVNVVAVYTHYYAFFLVAVQAIYLAIWRLGNRHEGHTTRDGLLAQAAVVLAYLPWAGFALNRYAVDESYWQGVLSLDFVRKTILAFAAGHTVFEAQAQAIAIGYVVLALIGIAVAARPWQTLPSSPHPHPVRGERALGDAVRAIVFLLLYLVVPFLLLYLLSAWRPKFNPRYLMLASPPFFILVAGGAEGLWARRHALLRALAVAGLLYVLATSAYALANNYRNRVLARDDFRSVAARIVAERQPGEAVILCSGHMYPVFQYYAPAITPYRIPDLETLSTRAVLTYDVAERLNEIAAKHSGVWLVLWQSDVVDPNNILTGLLDAQAERVPLQSQFWGIELRRYRLSPDMAFARPVIANVTNVNFGDRLGLLGYAPGATETTSGQAIALTLFWQARQPLNDDYWLALRLVDSRGHIYGRLDQRPASYTYPTMRWQPGVTVPGQALLPVAAGAPPGDYRLEAIVYLPARGQSLDVLDERGAPSGASAIIGAVRVGQPASPPSIESLGLARVLRLPMGDGMELAATSLGQRAVQQGETLTFDLAWRNREKLAEDYRLRLRLTTPDGVLLQETLTDLTGAGYQTSAWPAGSIVRGQYDLAIPADAPSQIVVGVALAGGRAPAGDAQTVALLNVTPIARLTTAPAIEHIQRAAFGGIAVLLGYDLAPAAVQPGQAISLTLYWQAGPGGRQERGYTVFAHLLGADQRIYGQHDSPPADGARPTNGWIEGEIIVDRRILVVQPAAPAGDHVIEVGLYDRVTNRRLDAVAESETRADHIILSTRVRVEQ